MRGYGFSVWLLPRNRGKIIEIMKKQGITITHTPHITIKTNFETKKKAFAFARKLTPTVNLAEAMRDPNHKCYTYSLSGKVFWADRSYDVDPLTAWVVNANVPKLNIPHAHLSVKYMDSYTFPKSAKINISGDGDVVVADTQDSNPVKWDLCYYED